MKLLKKRAKDFVLLLQFLLFVLFCFVPLSLHLNFCSFFPQILNFNSLFLTLFAYAVAWYYTPAVSHFC